MRKRVIWESGMSSPARARKLVNESSFADSLSKFSEHLLLTRLCKFRRIQISQFLFFGFLDFRIFRYFSSSFRSIFVDGRIFPNQSGLIKAAIHFLFLALRWISELCARLLVLIRLWQSFANPILC